MMIVRFRSNEEHTEMLNKANKVKKLAEELVDCLEEAVEEPEYRSPSYRRDYDEDEWKYEKKGRYGYNFPRR